MFIVGQRTNGFKNHSTCTRGHTIQYDLSHALDNNHHALMASLDLSTAFDVVKIRLLKNRLGVICLTDDVVNLIKAWFRSRMFFINIDSKSSFILASNSGTIQGSILDPILYAIFVYPVFGLESMLNYADDNYMVRCKSSFKRLTIDLEKSLKSISKRLRDSGLKVNDSKTELCLFHCTTVRQITLTQNNNEIQSPPSFRSHF